MERNRGTNIYTVHYHDENHDSSIIGKQSLEPDDVEISKDADDIYSDPDDNPYQFEIDSTLLFHSNCNKNSLLLFLLSINRNLFCFVCR